MTDEAREAFTREVLKAWGGYNEYNIAANPYGKYIRKAWLYDARIALERLGYEFRSRGTHYEVWIYLGAAVGHWSSNHDTLDAAIEAAVQHWWEEQQ